MLCIYLCVYLFISIIAVTSSLLVSVRDERTVMALAVPAVTSKHAPCGATFHSGSHLCQSCDFGGFTILPGRHHLN